MAIEQAASLAPAPADVLTPDGAARFGTYAGSLSAVDLRPRLGGGPGGRLRQLWRLKRWHYGCVTTREVFVGFALVDIGYASNAFVVVVDLVNGKTVASRGFMGLPAFGVSLNDEPGEGASGTFRAPGCSLRIARARGAPSFEIQVDAGDVHVDAVLDAIAAPPPLAAILPSMGTGGDAFLTQKTALLPSAGSVRVGASQWSLGGGWGGLDYTHGLLPRATAWRWAFAMGRAQDGTPVALNLTDGLSEQLPGDNALWVGRELFALGRARFTYDANHLEGPWQVRTDDGALDLRFQAKGRHREDRNLGLVVSRFAQIIGTFSGTARDPSGRTHVLVDVPGCVEDQRVKW